MSQIDGALPSTSARLSHHSAAAAAGLLLSAVWAGDIDRQRQALGNGAAANTGSVVLTA